jgi:hypothetical protein
MDKKLCKCGCGTQINYFDKRGRERFYAINHANRGLVRSQLTKEKLRQKNMGKKLSEETKRKIGEKSKLRKNNLGKVLSKEWKENISKGGKGKKRSISARLNMSICRRGNKNHSWKGGIELLRDQIRDLFEYRLWRSDVFTRDDFTCQKCFVRGGQLHAHHIKHFSEIIEKYNITTSDDARLCQELWNINNGITLCETCHKQEHKKVL